jgi:hypothetical protein
MSNNQFFPSIGAIADQTDNGEEPNVSGDTSDAVAGDDRPIQSIESLCMKCGEQVSA